MTGSNNGSSLNRGFKLFLVGQGIRQIEVADATGWAEAKVSRLANGRKAPTEDDLLVLAHIFSMSVEALKKECGW